MKISKMYFSLITIVLLLTINISAQDGTLDPTFGVDGVVDVGGENVYITQHKSLPDNKSLVLLHKDNIFQILKLNVDGSVDSSFGENGSANLSEIVGDTNPTFIHLREFDITLDGKIVIGTVIDVQSDSVGVGGMYLTIIQLNANGELNTEFGNDGIVKKELINPGRLGHIIDGSGRIRVTPNNDIIVTALNLENRTIASLLRLNSKGTFDFSFGTDGVFEYIHQTYGKNRLAVDLDGNIFYGDGSYIVKVFENGLIDDSFASSGYFNSSLSIRDIDFQSDGKIIATSTSWDSDNSKFIPVISRINKNGVLDSSFAVNGTQDIIFNSNTAILRNTIVMPGDDIISGGYSYIFSDSEFEYEVVLSKLKNNGSFVESFGDGGKVILDLYDNSEERTSGLIVNSETYDITISVAREMPDSSRSLILARFLNSRSYSSKHVSGNVAGKWEGIDTVYVDGHITIPEDSTLQIYPGTNVYFTGEYEFNVYGTLLAIGSETDSLFFFSDSLGWNSDARDYKGFWYGITFHKTDLTNQSTSALNYCSIKYGAERWVDEASSEFNRRFGGGLIYYKSTIDVKNTKLSDCNNDGVISSIYSSGNLKNVSMIRCGSLTLLSSEVDFNELNMYKCNRFYIDSSTGVLENSKIDNSGIVYFENSEFTITNCKIVNNYVGIKAESSNLTIEHTLIKGNSSDGGLFIESPTIIKNCEILENGRDGLSFNSETQWQTIFTSYIDNSLIAKNGDVGMRFQANNNGFVTNCTIANNTSSNSRGGIKTLDSEVHVKNSIVYQNGSNFEYQTLGFFTYSIVQGFYPGSDTAKTNLDNVDPLFRDAENGDYHLQSIACGNTSDSPGIDAGDPSMSDYVLDCATAGLGTKLTDIGAYGGEGNWWDKSVVPDCHVSGEVSGTWECETIYIDGDILIPYGDTLYITEAVDRVSITGPYQIKVEGVLLAIGPEDERAETDVNGDFIKFQGSNWKGIFFNNLNDSEVGTSIISNCRFDYANKMDMTYQGGGAIAIYNSDNVEVKHSVFYANSARYGGAMYIENSNPHIEDCYFELNGKEIGQNAGALTTAGGALYIKTSNPYLHKLQFINNHSISGGGAVVVDNSSITMSNILLAKNETEGMGGAIEVLSNINGSLLKIINMTSADNVSIRNGGGTFHTNGENTELEIINSIMYDNTKVEINSEGKTPVITYSIIDSASTESYFGEGCLEENPYFAVGTRYKLSNNSCSYSEGNTVVSTAIDAGHPDSLDAILDCYEGLGTSRADMGYYGGRYSDMPVGVKDGIETQIPSKYELAQNYPNPFNPSTTIQFALPKAGMVSLKIYNILGEEVAELVNREMNAGFQSVNFDASHLSSGLYLYRISADSFVDVKKMLLLK